MSIVLLSKHNLERRERTVQIRQGISSFLEFIPNLQFHNMLESVWGLAIGRNRNGNANAIDIWEECTVNLF